MLERRDGTGGNSLMNSQCRHGNRSGPVASCVNGFTLIELLVAISVAGILLAIAIPSFTGIMISNRLTVTTNDYVTALNVARMQAVKRNRPAQFCSNSSTTNTSDVLGTQCSNIAASVVSKNADNTTATTIRNPTTLPPSILLGDGTTNSTVAMAALRYANNGIANAPSSTTPYSGLVVDIYSTRISANNHRCIYMTTGSSINSCRLSAACPSTAPTTSTGCPQ